ncbi:LysR family transcriptional regulator [Paraburkholderia rhizosphaerae]|uniref:LysR family transcriptional regulator AphB n=1 Tax=Paraburkholderia rhizosphaerae TaxID=480658 RepID=A0A4R8LIG7_9BURK|nr:LysR family transcriptional regulator [Paraburkholderia rhizosphaerae]TDY42208.1 LysR family transcriptional regulator AphB [Paraburkholderia rhizosphaerae]
MDLNDVALFVQVIRAGSLAEAGRRLGIPASTCSRRIQQLERNLGVRLMQRSTRRLALTGAGQDFFQRCAEQVDALAESARKMLDAGESVCGRIRVAAPADFFHWFPLERIAQFLAKYPNVSLEFEPRDGSTDMLSENIDVAIRTGQVDEPTLVARPFGATQKKLVASSSYLRARGIPLSPADLVSHDCIVSPRPNGARVVWRLDGPYGLEQIPVKGRFHVSTSHAQLGAAVAGLGIALLPTFMLECSLRTGKLCEVLPGYAYRDVRVYFTYLTRRHIPRAVSAFAEFVRTVMIEEQLIDALPTAARAGEMKAASDVL